MHIYTLSSFTPVFNLSVSLPLNASATLYDHLAEGNEPACASRRISQDGIYNVNLCRVINRHFNLKVDIMGLLGVGVLLVLLEDLGQALPG